MKIAYRGKITFAIDKNHPDIKCLNDWAEDKIYTFEDEYYFNTHYTTSEIISYIQNDLMLVAGGGYNTKHIHNVNFEIKQV